MARHQAIRKLDLSAELADYDYAYDDEEEYDDGYGNGGGDGGDSGYEMSEEDKKQMKAALSKVKATIGHVPGCSDKAIEDLLWDYYYDVEKTVGYILDNYRQAPPPKQQQKKKQQGKGQAAAGVQVKGGGQNNKATVNTPPAASSSAFAEPSPDDKVLAAQSQVKGFGGGKAKVKPVTKSSTPADDVANGVKDINIGVSQPNNAVSNTAELERIAKTRKNLNVEEEYKKLKAKENANFVVIGHVDAGKSTLMGRLLYDLGVVDERTLKKYKQEAEKIGKSSFAFAWVLDQTSEERNRGVTIDIASNKFETENCSYTVLDAPGHKDFIPNMIAGASQADFAVLVIDSTTGEFETGFNFRGQTKEHTLLVRTMGVQRIIVAVNKLDNVNWSSARFEEITTQIGQFLTSAGFNPKNVAFVPCSGLTGDNVTKKPKTGLMPWYTGGTLLDELEKTKPSKRAIGKPFRLTVADVFRGGIIHPVSVAGRIDAGSVQVGDVLLDMPTGEKVAVKAIEVDDESRDWAIAGHNAVLHLGGIEIDHIRQGDILCDPQSPIPAVSTFNIKILAFESVTPMMVDIHRGRLNAAGKVAKLIALYDKSTGAVAKKKPRHIPAGGTAIITVQVEQGNSIMARAGTIPVEPGTRIVLRAFGQTVAAGLVESSS